MNEDKFTGDARNAKIERELNDIYTALMRKLNSAARNNSESNSRHGSNIDEAFVEKFNQTLTSERKWRIAESYFDRSLREMTEKRVAELRKY